MNIELKGKTAFVTGSTLGIGLAIARGLVATGAKVIVNGRTEARVNEAIAKLKAEYPNAEIEGIAADLGTAEGAEKAYAELPEVDILVNNLGIFEPKPFFEIPDEDWHRFFDVNVLSGIRMSRHYAPGMRERGWGRVIFIASESAIMIPTEMIHYGMTKTAMLAVSRGLAQELKGTGVTVNTVLPGPTITEGVDEFVRKLAADPSLPFEELEKEFFANARPGSLLQRFITPEEVANLVTYVASEQSAATTGAGLRVDGGLATSLL